MDISAFPITSILVIAGIASIIIALVKISGRIEFNCEHPILVGIFGLLLLSSGIYFEIAGTLDSKTPNSPPSSYPNSTLIAEDASKQTVTGTVLEDSEDPISPKEIILPEKQIEKSTPEIQITYPLNGTQVNITESVKGTQENIPDDKAIWIVVFSYEAYNYHPIKKARIQNGVSDFTVPVTIGTEGDVGDKFEIIAVLANKSAQEEFKNYLETAAFNHWPGMELPEGAEEYCTVMVTRK